MNETSPQARRPISVKNILCIALIAVVAGAMAQDSAVRPHPVRAFRFGVRHADPYMIKSLLEGRHITSPEIGTILGVSGMSGAIGSAAAAANAAFSLLKDGVLLVNPTDNSLWWFPKN